ncbi:MAG: PepSY domain-containing protein [bacterium]|nr:PepSY domain-containing protein [bacterium]
MRNKKKRRWITGWMLAFWLLFAGILGCGASVANTEYIGIEAAKEAALRAAEVLEEQAVFSDTGLNKKNNIFYYQVIFRVDNVEYEYDIDALTGVVIEATERTKLQQMQETPNISQTEEEKETISSDTEAMEAFGGSGKKEYRNLDSSGALKAALDYAGLAEEEIRSQEVEADEKDGKRVFEIELVSLEGVEYDYEIRAEDGRVLSFDYDAGDFLKENNAAPMDIGILSEEQAKQTALSCVPGAKAEDIVMVLKEDDGRMKYTGYLIYEGMQYEFKIDAYSGYLIEWEAESLIP